jgi:hypothetical protein
MSSERLGTKNHCAGEDQQQLNNLVENVREMRLWGVVRQSSADWDVSTEAEATVENRYPAMTGEDKADWEGTICAVLRSQARGLARPFDYL